MWDPPTHGLTHTHDPLTHDHQPHDRKAATAVPVDDSSEGEGGGAGGEEDDIVIEGLPIEVRKPSSKKAKAAAASTDDGNDVDISEFVVRRARRRGTTI
jgi:hypothetical protein